MYYFQYHINSHDLFCAQRASGINTRMFNDVVEYVTGKRTSKEMVKFLGRLKGETDCNEIVNDQRCSLKHVGKWSNIDGAEFCLEFLDYYFTYCVEWSPHGTYEMIFLLRATLSNIPFCRETCSISAYDVQTAVQKLLLAAYSRKQSIRS